MKATELHDLPGQELEQKLQEFKRELFNLRFQIATHQQENTAGLNRTRRVIRMRQRRQPKSHIDHDALIILADLIEAALKTIHDPLNGLHQVLCHLQ